jgi:hypothetical protein
MKFDMSLYEQLPLDIQREITQRVLVDVDRALYEGIYKKEKDRCIRHLKAVIRNCTIRFNNSPVRISKPLADILSYDPYGVYRQGYLISRIVTYIRKDPDMFDRFEKIFPCVQIPRDGSKTQQYWKIYKIVCYHMYTADGGLQMYKIITNNFLSLNINE